jgi:hypothetical protein
MKFIYIQLLKPLHLGILGNDFYLLSAGMKFKHLRIVCRIFRHVWCPSWMKKKCILMNKNFCCPQTYLKLAWFIFSWISVLSDHWQASWNIYMMFVFINVDKIMLKQHDAMSGLNIPDWKSKFIKGNIVFIIKGQFITVLTSNVFFLDATI